MNIKGERWVLVAVVPEGGLIPNIEYDRMTWRVLGINKKDNLTKTYQARFWKLVSKGESK